MTQLTVVAALALTMNLSALAYAGARQQSGKGTPLSASDRAEIQELSASYARTLGTCAAEEYAGLFVSPDGFYESIIRGRVLGRERLIALVRSERHCNDGSGSTRPARPVPVVTIKESPSGVTGTASLGDSGQYEDVYVRTASGWRFKSRNNVPAKAVAAKFTYQDFAEIRRLAGDHGQYEDVYVDTPQGRHFRSSGLTIDPVSLNQATGKARLGNGQGQYDDVYVKSADGWRFQSRTHLPAPPQASSAQARPGAGVPALTALDYLEIQQLVNRYAFAIDSCSNNGYDYADLYVPDGVFMNSSSRTRWQGRERLAEAAGGGSRGCKKLGEKTQVGRSHTTVNLVIEPSPEGATGRSYLVYPGEQGVHSDPGHSGHVGGYQDVYVKTPQGWRFKSRVHVMPPIIPGTYKIPDVSSAPPPAQAAPGR